MDCLAMSVESSQLDMSEDHLLESAFGLGWASADEAHIPTLPLAAARLLGAQSVRMSVVHWNGTLVLEHMHPEPEAANADGPVAVETLLADLGPEYQLRLTVEFAGDPTGEQREMLQRVMRLVQLGLECILVQQRDKNALGESFERLSAREWEICQALERPDGEKQIAGTLACSRHTLHSYVKSLYRKMQAQSRLQVLDQLQRAREELRRQAMSRFVGGNRTRVGVGRCAGHEAGRA